MELMKKNIHMDRMKCRAGTQITLEDDRNVPDNRPDIGSLILEKGQVVVEEIKATEDHVGVKGRLDFQVLYLPEDAGEGMSRLEGSVPFEEQVYMENVSGTDTVCIRQKMEDLRVGRINSRKVSVQAVVGLQLWVDELYDEETAVDIYQAEDIECRKQTLQLAEIAIQKKDIFRIKEELEMPQNFPNIFQLIWEDIRLGNVEFRPLEEKLSIQGEVNAFFLYEGEGEERIPRWYETTLPFSGVIDCQGCRENMIPDIVCEIGHKEVEVRADFDGEERLIGLELVLDLDMAIYEEEQVEILADVYGVTKEVQALTREALYNDLLVKSAGKLKVAERGKLKAALPRMVQLCHSQGEVQVESAQVAEGGIAVNGTLAVTVLYRTGEAEAYAVYRGEFPIAYTLEAPGIGESCRFRVESVLEQLSVSMLDGEELDIKALVGLRAVVFCDVPEQIITEVTVNELDGDKLKELPGMVAYVAQAGDSLWQLGKKYYVPVSQIKELNHLNGEELKAGEKLLIVR